MEVSIADIVTRLGVSMVTVNKWRNPPPASLRYALPFRKEGKQVYIEESELKEFLEEYRPDLLDKWNTSATTPRAPKPTRPPPEPDTSRLKNVAITTTARSGRPCYEITIPIDEEALAQAPPTKANRALVLATTGGWFRMPPVNGRRVFLTMMLTIEKPK